MIEKRANNKFMTKNIMRAEATGKYLRLSTHKARRVLQQIQGKYYAEARLMLQFMPYKAAKPILKILESAVNNISQKNSNNINKKQLRIIQAITNKGPTLKRFQPRAQGRAFPIHKPTCHIQIKIAISS
uniref:Large ribosomal subunit protein uL22c n=1 Tax=Bornetia secundiflora TaxID=2575637 RepID=A0A4D6WRA3_9FLOR|nr:ribosomal protein L22 [Bornetia secundiflora]